MTNTRRVLIVLLAMLLATMTLAAGPEDEATEPYRSDDELSLPEEEVAGIMATLEEDGGMLTLASLLRECGLDSVLSQAGPFTLFAPDDSAFAAMPADRRDALLADRTALKAMLEHHIVKGSSLEFEETGDLTVRALDGRDLMIFADYEEVKVGDATVIDEGIWCRNGIIHVIDRVLTVAEPAGKDR